MAIFFLIGQNRFLIEEKLASFNTKKIFLSYNKDFKIFFLELQKITNRNLLGEKFIIVLKNIDQLKKNDLLTLAHFLKSSNNDFILIFNEEPLEILSLFQKLNLKFKNIRLRSLSHRNFEKFILDYADANKIKLSPSIINFLKENYYGNFDLLLNDLKKISFLGGLNQKDLGQIFHFKTDIFKVQDYFLDKNWPLFIHHFKKIIIEDRTYGRTETLRTLSLLFNSLLKIYLLKTGNLKSFKNNYYLMKLREKSLKLNLDDIKRLIFAIAKTEKKFKKFYLEAKDIPEDISLNYLFLT